MQKIKEFVKYNQIIYKAYYYIASLFVNILKIFVKVNPKKILFLSYGGKHYSDSPKNIYEAMLQDKRFYDFEFVWAFVNPEEYDIPGNARKIKIDTLRYYITALESRVWITNVIIERALNFTGKKTFYLGTNHGIPLKEVKDNENVFNTLSEYRYDGMLAQSEFEAELDVHQFKIEKSKIHIVGYPRNDLLAVNPSFVRDKIRNFYKIPENKKILLYAPTYRDWEKGTGCLNINLIKWKEKLESEYVLLYRAHPTIKFEFAVNENSFFKNATEYENMDELMIATDVFISDYSSSFFDFSILGKPMICWAYDYAEFSKYRNLKVNVLDEVYGGIITEDELINLIHHLPIKEILRKTREFQEKYVTVFGNASKEAIDIIWSNIVE